MTLHRTMLQLINEYHEALPYELSKKYVYSEIIICHIDESVLFDDGSTIGVISQVLL